MLGFLKGFRINSLSKQGVLGMNRRNVGYISRYNPRHLFPLVDDKLQTKKLAIKYGVTTPNLIGVIERQHDIRNLEAILEGCDGFCLKPAKGSGGKGILALTRGEGSTYHKPSGEQISLRDIERHCSNILAGLFSLGGKVDVVIIEGLLKADESFNQYSHEGVPDIRIIVFCGIPVMAMMRLSCTASHGKANLHQGAVGVGLSMSTGAAVNAVQYNQQIILHPDTGANLMDIKIPDWEALLILGCECYEMSGLGYLGVDLVLDKNQGATLLELNARPGLSIQIANDAGLLPRLKRVEGLEDPERMTAQSRVTYAREHF